MIKKAEAIERMKQGAILRHAIGFHSETWLLGNEQVHGNTGNALVKTAGVEYLKQDGRFSTYAWKQEETTQEALEAQVTQAADDLAGKEAYEETRLETLEKENDDLKTQIVNLASESIVLEQQNEELRAENEALKAERKRVISCLNAIAGSGSHVFAVHYANNMLNELEGTPTPEQVPAPIAQAEASEVTLTDEQIDWLAKHNFSSHGFSAYFRTPISEGVTEILNHDGDIHLDLYDLKLAYRTPTNRAAIEARRKELGLAVQS